MNLQVDAVPFLVRSGDHREAFDLLELGVAQEAVVAYDWLLMDPWLAPLRSQARFLPLAQRAKVRFDVERARVTEAAKRGELPSYLGDPVADLERLDMQLASLVERAARN